MNSAMSARVVVALFLVVAAVQGANALRHSFEQGVGAKDCPVDFRKVDLVSVEAACNNDVADASVCCATLYRMVTPYAGVLNAIDSCAGAFLEAFAASSLSNNDQVLRCFEENVGSTVLEDAASARVLQDEAMAEASEAPLGIPAAPAAPETEDENHNRPVPGGGRPSTTEVAAEESKPNHARALRVGFGSLIAAVVTCMIAPFFIIVA